MTRFEDIKAFAFDVDGVFTDGLVLAMPDGDLLRQFNSKDCFGVRTAVDNGFPCAFITGGVSPSLLHRAHSLGIGDENLYMISKNKAEDLLHFCKRNGLEPWQVAFVGDDIPDIPAIELAGLGVCPADAVAEVREARQWIRAVVEHGTPTVLPEQAYTVTRILEGIYESATSGSIYTF